MLLALVVLCLSQSSIVAGPTANATSGWDIVQQMSTSQVSSPDQQRTLWDIVKSCLVTIFACSWVSVHPNIPPPHEKWWMGPLRRLELMIWAIIAPELIILWAMRQWIGAKNLANSNRELGWTKTHGHFYQMGGFRDFGDPSECPCMTEEEIQDLSKADALSKALVVIQTLWFVTQCVVRHLEGLYITELELATAAFAMINGAMYFLWWDKPLAVQCSIRKQSFGKLQTAPTKPFPISLSAIRLRLSDRISEILHSSYRESAFYAASSDGDNTLALCCALLVATIFGGIHCAGWSFDFPSHVELRIWRVSSAAITSFPAITLIIGLCGGVVPYAIGGALGLMLVLCLPFYIVARILLLVEAFTTLRKLPLEAYAVVRWTTFIPHI